MVLFLCTFVLLACQVTMETSKFEEINSQIYLFENIFLVFDCFFSLFHSFLLEFRIVLEVNKMLAIACFLWKFFSFFTTCPTLTWLKSAKMLCCFVFFFPSVWALMDNTLSNGCSQANQHTDANFWSRG